MGDAGSREEPLGPSMWPGSRPFTAATQVSEFEGKVSWQLPSWSLGLRIDHLFEVFTQEAPSWLCRVASPERSERSCLAALRLHPPRGWSRGFSLPPTTGFQISSRAEPREEVLGDWANLLRPAVKRTLTILGTGHVHISNTSNGATKSLYTRVVRSSRGWPPRRSV